MTHACIRCGKTSDGWMQRPNCWEPAFATGSSPDEAEAALQTLEASCRCGLVAGSGVLGGSGDEECAPATPGAPVVLDAPGPRGPPALLRPDCTLARFLRETPSLTPFLRLWARADAKLRSKLVESGVLTSPPEVWGSGGKVSVSLLSFLAALFEHYDESTARVLHRLARNLLAGPFESAFKSLFLSKYADRTVQSNLHLQFSRCLAGLAKIDPDNVLAFVDWSTLR